MHSTLIFLIPKARIITLRELTDLNGFEDSTLSYKVYRELKEGFKPINKNDNFYIARNVSDLQEVYGNINVEYIGDYWHFVENYQDESLSCVLSSLNHEKGYL